MEISQLAPVLAHTNIGAGIGIGIGIGNGSGRRQGMSYGAAGAKDEVKRQLTAAISSGEISVVGKGGESMTSESLLQLLDEKFNKA